MRARREHTKLEPASIYRLQEGRPEQGSFDWHYHEAAEITLVVKGSGTRYIGDSIEEFNTGEVVIVGPGIPHTWAPATGGDETHTSVVHIAVNQLPDLPELDLVKALFNKASRGLVIPSGPSAQMAGTMSLVWASEGLQQLLGVLSILDLASKQQNTARPLASVAYAHGRKSGTNDLDETRMETILKLVREDLANGIDQTHLAAEVGLTPSSFSRFFKRETGRTFTTFVHEMRVAEACSLLANTDLGVAQIAYRIGFKSLPHFNKVFLRLKDRTPSDWRLAHEVRGATAP